MAAARLRISPSRLTLKSSDHRSIAEVASCRTHVCVQSIETMDGMRSIRSSAA
jgi:hypothetical protein